MLEITSDGDFDTGKYAYCWRFMQGWVKLFHHKFKCNTSVVLRFANPDLVFHNIKCQENIRQLKFHQNFYIKLRIKYLMKFSRYKLQGLGNDVKLYLSLTHVMNQILAQSLG